MIFILFVFKVDLYVGEERRSKSQWYLEQGINEREKIFKEKQGVMLSFLVIDVVMWVVRICGGLIIKIVYLELKFIRK